MASHQLRIKSGMAFANFLNDLRVGDKTPFLRPASPKRGRRGRITKDILLRGRRFMMMFFPMGLRLCQKGLASGGQLIRILL